MNIGWDYPNNEVPLSMLSYVQDTLKIFYHIQPRWKQDQPHTHVKPTYRAKVQYATNEDTSPASSPVEKKFTQEVTGTFLHYARAVDAIMLPALEFITTQQANPTANTMKKVKHFLDYATTHPNAIITHHTSNMVLTAYSNASHFFRVKNVKPRRGTLFHVSQQRRPSK